MKLARKVGATSEIFQVFIQDSSSSSGAGLTGLAFNTASLTAYYHRDTDTTATAITLATMTVGTFTSSGFKEIDATNMPGWYQFCPPNAALATGAKSCGFHLKGATNMVPLPIEVDLNVQVAEVVGLTASDVGAIKTKTDNLPASPASTTNITAGTITTTTNLTNAPTSGDLTATMKTSIGTAVAASAVASVTGNVGGNVTGSVGSVSSITASGGIVSADIKKVNNVTVTGTGASGSEWGP